MNNIDYPSITLNKNNNSIIRASFTADTNDLVLQFRNESERTHFQEAITIFNRRIKPPIQIETPVIEETKTTKETNLSVFAAKEANLNPSINEPLSQ